MNAILNTKYQIRFSKLFTNCYKNRQMTFYINVCSSSLSFGDSLINLYQIIMLSVLAAQIFLILLLRIGSALKNHDINSLKIHNKRTVIPVESIPANLISNIINCQKQPSYQKKQEKSLSNIIRIAKSKNKKEESENSSSSSQNSQASNQQHQNYIHQPLPEKWFINVSQLKLTFQQFNQNFPLIFGFSFISICLAIKNFPFFYSCILCLIQFLVVIVLIFQAILSKSVQEIELNERQKQQNFRSKLRIFWVSIICTINVGLIVLSIIGLNMSYYDSTQMKCLF